MEKAILFKVDEKTNELLKETAENTKRSKSELIRQVLKEYLQRTVQDSATDTTTHPPYPLPPYPLMDKLNCKIDNLALRLETLELKLEKILYTLKITQIQDDENSSKENMKEVQVELTKKALSKKTE